MALIQLLNGHVRFASLFDQDGPVTVSNVLPITSDQFNPDFFIQVPLVTGYKPMVTPKKKGGTRRRMLPKHHHDMLRF
jgi:hypothetical protein